MWTPPADVRDDDAGRPLHGLARRRSAASTSTTTTRCSAGRSRTSRASGAAIWDFFGVRAHTPYERVLSERVMPGARVVRGRDAQLRRAHGRRRRGPRPRRRARPLADARPVRADVRRPARPGRAGARRARAPRRRPRRPRRRLPAEHPRDARRVPRDREPRRDLGDLRARVRRARGDRPLRRSSSRRCCSRSPATATAPSTSTAAPRSPRSAPSCRTLEHVVHVPYAGGADDALAGRASSGTTSWPSPRPLRFDPVPFDHPLYVLFSSGTTGLPKPIVHGHGGILVEALQEPRAELGPAARRPAHVVHDDRVDDVERARLLAPAPDLDRDDRRQPGLPRPLDAVAPGGGDAADVHGREPRAAHGLPQGRHRPRRASTCRASASSAPPARRCRPRATRGSTSSSGPTCCSTAARAAPTSAPASSRAAR